ncbi:addiction module toxin RelE [Serratia odorifera]|nr:addiction module toxin RelE [Serratia odorifera]RII72674.1 addiction module toxin RelE [Serratia odorifera]
MERNTKHIISTTYYRPIDFELQPGGKCQNPQSLTQVSDWGSVIKTTTLQLER